MIIDLQRFIETEREFWSELETLLNRFETEPEYRMTLKEIERFHLLYQRTSADLQRMMTFSSEPEVHRYLESLTARAYACIHEIRERPYRLSPLKWFFRTLPRTFRKHIRAFALSLIITAAGFLFGGIAIALDPGSKAVFLPLEHLIGSPSERVAEEEMASEDRLRGVKRTGAAWYMSHNTRVSIFVMALGMTWGVGTVLMLFYNGVILGAVTIDYFLARQGEFLIAWLSPHGVIEIPAVLIAGQAGLILAGALIGWGRPVSMGSRLREISGDLMNLICGVALMLAWAGFIESFVSQYHEPVIPYAFKIAFGTAEFVLLILFFTLSGRKSGGGRSNELSPRM
ncbi:MAG TPA: stage II sporulation protein M [Thermodesulfovibrionales bacterium]|nr:stage II sporulation protein M [Thermodesulfovibrionales bacterium]